MNKLSKIYYINFIFLTIKYKKKKNCYTGTGAILAMSHVNQSAAGAGGLGIIRGNKVGKRDSTVEFALW